MSTSHTRAPARNIGRLLASRQAGTESVRYQPFTTIFAQGDPCAVVMYIEKGRVKLTVTSHAGRQAVIGILGAGAFFGEGALAGQRRRTTTAETITASRIMMVKTAEMRRRLHEESALSDWFRLHLLNMNNRIEAALLDQIFDGCEMRLARTRRSQSSRRTVPTACKALTWKPGFLRGFDEADRGKDVREDQRSGKQCRCSVRAIRRPNKDKQ
ncbi:MAG: cyclic nucleotide-binding domain-containing protein [Chloroflexi bacterium]|nr:MAG: cyclic nucleotide-binding domain-containing protein [Chloroflexota bacterium]